MKNLLFNSIVTRLVMPLVTVTAIGCSSTSPLATEPGSVTQKFTAPDSRSSSDASVKFEDVLVEVDVNSRAVTFASRSERFLVDKDATIRNGQVGSVVSNMSLKDLEQGMFLRVEGTLLTKETVVLTSLTVIINGPHQTGYERTPEN